MYRGHDLDLSGSRDVIVHVTIRLAVHAQLRVETTHDVSGAPPTPDVRVDYDDDDEEQGAEIVNAETDYEHVYDAATKFGDPQQRNQDPASSNYCFD